MEFEYGQWTTTVSEEESSNWREFANLVLFLENKAALGHLSGAEVFMFTDNQVTENAFWKGSSRSRKLNELVLWLRMLEHNVGMILHVIHVSGRRMIAQGTDGLSRGDYSSGVMSGRDICDFIPLHLSALECSPQLNKWVEGIAEETGAEILTPEGWFDEGHGDNDCIWAPPPAAASVVVEQLSLVRHKCPEVFHMVVVPRLMTGYWRKHMGWAADCCIQIESEELWPLQTQFEPVLIFCFLPFKSHQPRFEEKTQLLEKLRRGLLPESGLLKVHTEDGRDRVCKLWFEARNLSRV